MIGRRVAEDPATGTAALPRGALLVLVWIKSYGSGVVLGANNVGDAFTPMRGADPLAMIAGVGVIYQGGS